MNSLKMRAVYDALCKHACGFSYSQFILFLEIKKNKEREN